VTDASAPDALTIRQLHIRSKNALAREMRGLVFVSGEIKSFKTSRASLFLTLCDSDDDGDISIDVAVWPKRHALLAAQLESAGLALTAGMHVRISGTVTISKVGRLTVELSSLDIEALIGNQAAQKRQLYKALGKEGLLDANKALPMPMVPLRVALVASNQTEGFNDFLRQLDSSPFDFNVTMLHSPVQGPAAPNALADAISRAQSIDCDLVVLIRGGGGELDAFDKEVVARAIATSKTPVWTGIGHTGDHSVADDVAQRFFITPTACGREIVETVNVYTNAVASVASRLRQHALGTAGIARSELSGRAQRLGREQKRYIAAVRSTLNVESRSLKAASDKIVLDNQRRLGLLTKAIPKSTNSNLTSISRHIRSLRKQTNALDPTRPLRQGYSITLDSSGNLVRTIEDVNDGDVLTTRVEDGTISSRVLNGEHK
jgi:exodeoxyribonuclease VII large subunit